jgi:hypothetical protein
VADGFGKRYGLRQSSSTWRKFVPPRNPLADLIQTRMSELGLDEEALGFRLGYKNPVKATGRIHALCYGHLSSRKSRYALNRLPEALELAPEVVEQALAATKDLLAEGRKREAEERRVYFEAREAEWRASFRPHAVIQTERTVPTQITICGLTGGPDRWLTIFFDTSKPPITFVQQALEALPTHVPFFGRPLGLIVNYSPDQAVRCDLDGRPLEVLPKAYRPGEVVLSCGGRPVLPRVIGGPV